MDATVNALNWFEISVSDIARAKKFYEEIFSMKMEEQEMMGMKMAFFPADGMNGKVGGGIVQGPYHKPSADGVKVYLNANPDMEAILAKIEKAGGKVTMPKTKITDEIGYMANFIDTEGNGMALHSNG
ncbi:MAG TPA: VOC family protein [Mucilaginibacter sp.]|jgi:predicted enzyme related to lactoylglutathione lyase|nr:VOC family protein [Mucilaginibacter sp.]